MRSHSHERARTDTSRETASGLTVAWVWLEGRNGERLLMCVVSFGDDKNLLKLDSCKGCTTLWIC